MEAVRRISDRLGADLMLDQPAPDDVPAQWHPGRMARVLAGQTAVGVVGELHPARQRGARLPGAFPRPFELDLTALFAALDNAPVQARPISTFPPVKQDFGVHGSPVGHGRGVGVGDP